MKKLKITIITLILIIASLIGYIVFQSSTYYGTVYAVDDRDNVESSTNEETSEDEFEQGDIDGDGEISASDAASCLIIANQRTLGKDDKEITLSSGKVTENNPAVDKAVLERADVDRNGVINAVDASYILQYAAYVGAGSECTELVMEEDDTIHEVTLENAKMEDYVKHTIKRERYLEYTKER